MRLLCRNRVEQPAELLSTRGGSGVACKEANERAVVKDWRGKRTVRGAASSPTASAGRAVGARWGGSC